MNENECEFCLYCEECSLAEQSNDNEYGNCSNFIDLNFIRKNDNSFWGEMSYNLTRFCCNE